jgi:hypothetical protein
LKWNWSEFLLSEEVPEKNNISLMMRVRSYDASLEESPTKR